MEGEQGMEREASDKMNSLEVSYLKSLGDIQVEVSINITGCR